MTIVIQIGNSDNKLTQLEWSNYDNKHSFDLREELLEPKNMYMQDSIAFTVGDTDFV